MRAALVDVELATSAPYSLIGISMFTAASTACQGHIDVKLPTASGKVTPVSLYSLFVGESGERRTTVNNLLCRAIYEHDQTKSKVYINEARQYKKKYEVWRTVKRKYTQAIAKTVISGESELSLSRLLDEHICEEPRKPRDRPTLVQRSSTTALLERLDGEGHSVAFISDEAQMMFDSPSTRNFGFFSKLWDGASVLSSNRTDKESFVASDPRATLCLMAHPATLRKFVAKHGEVARGSGYWARFLIASPPSKKGYRISTAPEGELRHLETFNSRVAELLSSFEQKDPDEQSKRVVLEFNDVASMEWKQLADQIEIDLGPSGPLHDISDFAAKFLEIVSRIAAVMHYFCGSGELIDNTTLRGAVHIGYWHLNQYRQLFGQSRPQDEADAELYISHFMTHYLSRGRQYVERKTLSHSGPLAARSKYRRDAALAILLEQGYLYQAFEDPNRRKGERLYIVQDKIHAYAGKSSII
jgi:hypothetical protein